VIPKRSLSNDPTKNIVVALFQSSTTCTALNPLPDMCLRPHVQKMSLRSCGRREGVGQCFCWVEDPDRQSSKRLIRSVPAAEVHCPASSFNLIIHHHPACIIHHDHRSTSSLGLVYTGIENIYPNNSTGIIPVYSHNGEICGICGIQKIYHAI
jgi:hypothetical protein